MDAKIEHDRHHKPDEEEVSFKQTNLVSDGFVSARTIDPNLINPWGVAYSPTGPFWVADNTSGVATIYSGNGTPVKVLGHLAITIATPSGGNVAKAAPTSEVLNLDGHGLRI